MQFCFLDFRNSNAKLPAYLEFPLVESGRFDFFQANCRIINTVGIGLRRGRVLRAGSPPAGGRFKGDGGADYVYRSSLAAVRTVDGEQQNLTRICIAAAVMGLARLRWRDATLGKENLDHVWHGVRNQQCFIEREGVVPGAPPVPQADVVVMEFGV